MCWMRWRRVNFVLTTYLKVLVGTRAASGDNTQMKKIVITIAALLLGANVFAIGRTKLVRDEIQPSLQDLSQLVNEVTEICTNEAPEVAGLIRPMANVAQTLLPATVDTILDVMEQYETLIHAFCVLLKIDPIRENILLQGVEKGDCSLDFMMQLIQLAVWATENERKY